MGFINILRGSRSFDVEDAVLGRVRGGASFLPLAGRAYRGHVKASWSGGSYEGDFTLLGGGAVALDERPEPTDAARTIEEGIRAAAARGGYLTDSGKA